MSETTDRVGAAIAELAAAPVSHVSAAVLLSPTAAGIRVRRVDLAADAIVRVKELTSEFRDQLQEKVPIEYSWQRRAEPHEVVVVPLEEVDSAAKTVIAMDNLENHGRLNLSKRESNSAKLFLIDARFKLNDEERRVVFVRTGVRSEVVKQSRKTALIFSNGVYDVVDQDQLVLNDRWDVAVLDGFVIGANTTRLENAFGFTERIFAAAQIALDTHISELDIRGFDDLVAACQHHPGMARKAASIGRKMDTPVYKGAMTMDSLLEFLGKHSTKMKIDTEPSESGTALIHDNDDASGRWAILKLLDDDYLTSELTSVFYEAPSKSEP